MPRLHVIYDPLDNIDIAVEHEDGDRIAVLSVPKDLKGVDIYNLARRLAELLLEQL